MRFVRIISQGLSLIAVLMAAQVAFAAAPLLIYVAPNGNDSAAGTQDKPLATIEAARDRVRQLRGKVASPAQAASDIRVILRGGIYTAAKPVVFSMEDSGDKDHSITYAAFPGEKPVISGAPILKPVWKASGHPSVPATAPANANQKIVLWTAQLPHGTWFQELFVNGKRQRRARWPATGTIESRDLKQSKTEFGFDPAKLPIATAGNLRPTAAIRTYEWEEELLPVASIDAKAGKITLARADEYPIVPKGYGSTHDFYLENLPGAVSAAGDWALDGDGVLTYCLPEGMDPKTLEFRGGTNVTLFDLMGQQSKKIFFQNVHFDGLTFTQTDRIEKLEWANYEGQALRMQEGVRNCTVRHCTFVDLGGAGVTLWRDCRDNTIGDNQFSTTGDTAILISDYLGEGESHSGGNKVVNNVIHDCGVVRLNADGIQVSGSDSNLIAHNLIYDMPYIGICVNGMMPSSWQQKFEPSLKPPFSMEKLQPFIHTQGNHVDFNYIHDVMQKMADGGAIYFWGEMGTKPNFVTNNLIERVGQTTVRTAVGIYMDDYTNDVQIRDNVVSYVNYGLHLHGTPRITVENNIFAHTRVVACSVQPEKYNTPDLQSVVLHNIFFLDSGTMGVGFTNWKLKPIKEMDFNCWWRPPTGKDLKLGFGQGFGKHSLIADPLFVDASKPQDGLKPDSPALTKLGMKPIDVSKVGPQPSPEDSH